MRLVVFAQPIVVDPPIVSGDFGLVVVGRAIIANTTKYCSCG
jgi:hypothetical protein